MDPEIFLMISRCPPPEGNKLLFMNYVILALLETVVFVLTMVAGFVHCTRFFIQNAARSLSIVLLLDRHGFELEGSLIQSLLRDGKPTSRNRWWGFDGCLQGFYTTLSCSVRSLPRFFLLLIQIIYSKRFPSPISLHFSTPPCVVFIEYRDDFSWYHIIQLEFAHMFAEYVLYSLRYWLLLISYRFLRFQRCVHSICATRILLHVRQARDRQFTGMGVSYTEHQTGVVTPLGLLLDTMDERAFGRSHTSDLDQ